MIRAMNESKLIHERGHYSSMDRHNVTQIVRSIEGNELPAQTSSDESNVLDKMLEKVNG